MTNEKEKAQTSDTTVTSTEPGYTPPMTVGTGGGNRNLKGIPFGPDGKRDWSVGLCGCEDEPGGCRTYCIAHWCPCIIYGKNKKRFVALQSGQRPEAEIDACNGDCWLHAVLYGFGWAWVLQASTRSDLRARYNIRGGCFGDAYTACCCHPCQLAQDHIELALEERSMGVERS